MILSMLSISLSMSVHIWCGVRRVGLARVIVYYSLYGLCDPREQLMIFYKKLKNVSCEYYHVNG